MPTGFGCVHMAGVGHEHLIAAMELLTSSGSPGLIKKTLHPGKLRINLAHHFQVTAYVTQIPSLQSAAGSWSTSDQWSHSWKKQGIIPRLLEYASSTTSCSGTLAGRNLGTSSVSLWGSRDIFLCEFNVHMAHIPSISRPCPPPPPPAPVIGRRENGNLARVSRPIGEDRVS